MLKVPNAMRTSACNVSCLYISFKWQNSDLLKMPLLPVSSNKIKNLYIYILLRKTFLRAVIYIGRVPKISQNTITICTFNIHVNIQVKDLYRDSSTNEEFWGSVFGAIPEKAINFMHNELLCKIFSTKLTR